MTSVKKNIGLYFGSFNPIHNGHIEIANFLIKTGCLDEVWFVVSPQSPFKEKYSLLNDNYRYQMVLMAIENNEHFHACDIEFNLPRPSYTINTLHELNKKYPAISFSLIMGADNLASIHQWKKSEEILKGYKIFVYPRKNSETEVLKNPASVIMIDAPLLDISSTAIRDLIRQGKDIGHLLPVKVFEYIKKMGFYRVRAGKKEADL